PSTACQAASSASNIARAKPAGLPARNAMPPFSRRIARATSGSVAIPRRESSSSRVDLPVPGPPVIAERAGTGMAALLVHRREEVLVGLGILHLVEEEFHRVDRAHLHEDAPEDPHLGELVLLDQQLF